MSDHHHKETFITKYIFSTDHKMIAKQFLITGMIMALIGMLMSAIFRVQLANPGEASVLYNLLPGSWLSALETRHLLLLRTRWILGTV